MITIWHNYCYLCAYKERKALSLASRIRTAGCWRETSGTTGMNSLALIYIWNISERGKDIILLEAGIVMEPRMNRVPKPKSVYWSFARSPGRVI